LSVGEEEIVRRPDFERLLARVLGEGKDFERPYRNTCPYLGHEWCYRIATEGSRGRIVGYECLNVEPCLYRERSGCCWVLATVELLATEYLARQGVDRPPVASELITLFDQRRKIEVRLVPLKVHHGAAWLTGGEWVIQLNARESRAARRHTLFHEAFHIVCRNAVPAFNKAALIHRPFWEILADHFATCFLMPKEWVEERWPMVQDVPRMARIFDVSVSAMRRRLNQLGLQKGAGNSS